MKVEAFFPTEKIFQLFDWIQIIVAVAGALRNSNGAKSTKLDKSPFKSEDNITKNEHSA